MNDERTNDDTRERAIDAYERECDERYARMIARENDDIYAYVRACRAIEQHT